MEANRLSEAERRTLVLRMLTNQKRMHTGEPQQRQPQGRNPGKAPSDRALGLLLPAPQVNIRVLGAAFICVGGTPSDSRLARGPGQRSRGAAGREPSRAAAHALSPLQESPAQRTTTSCGPHPTRGAASVCWATRRSSSAGRLTPRASTAKTLTGLWWWPTAPAPVRIMNGGCPCCLCLLSRVGLGAGMLPCPEETKES